MRTFGFLLIVIYVAFILSALKFIEAEAERIRGDAPKAERAQ